MIALENGSARMDAIEIIKGQIPSGWTKRKNGTNTMTNKLGYLFRRFERAGKWNPDKDQVSDAIQKYLESGGTIKTIKTNPSESRPRVMGKEWEDADQVLEKNENNFRP